MNKEKMELGKKMDEALHYVSSNLLISGHNTKPVLFHSFKVSFRLYELNYDENIVISAVLHDLIEDTDITYDDIKNKYGQKIADIVSAVSFDPKIDDKLEQSRRLFENCLNCGKAALLVKCSDLIDNIDFIMFVEDKEKRVQLLKKHKLFIEMSKSELANEEIYHILESKILEIERLK